MGNVGFQVAIYPACDFGGMPIFCKTACDADVVTIMLGTLSPCTEYTMIIDGCEGSDCDYSIQAGYSEPPIVSGVELEGPTMGCAGQELCFATDADWGQNGASFNCFPEFVWYLDDVEIFRGSERFPCFTFPDAGTFELCVITITRLPDQVLPRHVICYEYQPFYWFGREIDQSGTYMEEQQTSDGCLYTVIGEFVVAEPPEYGYIQEIVCGLEPPFVGPDGNIYPFAGYYPLTLSRQNFQGCDSLMDLDLVYLDVLFELTNYCTDGGMWIKPDSLEIVPIDTNVVYEWREKFTGRTLGSGDSLFVQDSGTFCLTISMTHLETSCAKEHCIKIPLFRPETPTLLGDTVVCNESPYTMSASACMDTCAILWEIPTGIPILSNTGSQITLDLSNESGSTLLLCARATNDCGQSDLSCIEVEVEAGPEAQAGMDQVICGELQVELGAIAPSGVSGMWSSSMGTFDDPNNPNAIFTAPDYGTYTLDWSLSTLDCESVDQVRITFSPPLNLSMVFDSCSLDSHGLYHVSALLDGGTPPYKLISGNGSIDPISGEFMSDLLPEGQNIQFIFEDSLGCEYEFTSFEECDCIGNEAEISISESVYCQNECIEIQTLQTGLLDPNDIGRYIIHDNPSVLSSSLREQVTSNTICYQDYSTILSLNTSYYISLLYGNQSGSGNEVDLTDPCLKMSNAVVFQFIDAPNARVVSPVDTCNLFGTLTAIPSSGNGRWEYPGATPGVNIENPNMATTRISVPTEGVFEFVWIEDNGACADSAVVSIQLSSPPNFRNLTVEWGQVEGNNAPFTIGTSSTIGGILSQSAGVWGFESDPIPNNNSYRIVIADNFGCETVVTGSVECDCGDIAPGSMLQDTLELCYTDFANAVVINPPTTNSANDTVFYVLHEGNGSLIVNPIIIQGNSTFQFDPNLLVPGRVYYISVVVGRKNSQGDIDLNDPCTRIAKGQPVRFLSEPTILFQTDNTQCFNEGLLIAVTSSGQGVWRQVSGPSPAIIHLPNMSQSPLSVTDAGLYSFEFTSSNNVCSNKDTIDVLFNDAPDFLVDEVVYECDPLNENYRVIFKITGDMAFDPEISGENLTGGPKVGTNLIGNNTYESEWVTSGDSVLWVLLEAKKCDTSEFLTDHLCDCTSKVGEWSEPRIELCIDETITPIWDETNQILDANDSIVFYLWDDLPGSGGVKVDSSSFPPEFSFQSGMMTGKVYYIEGVVGNGTIVGIDPSDRCLSRSELMELIFWSEPVIQLEGDNEIITCQESSVLVDAGNSQSESGGTLSFNWYSPDVIIPVEKQSKDTLRVMQSGEYCLTLTDELSGCIVDTCFYIDQDNQLPVIQLSNPDTITCLIDHVTIDASQSTQGANLSVEWEKITGSGQILGSSDTYQIEVNGPGQFQITLRDEQNMCEVIRVIDVYEDKTLPYFNLLPYSNIRCDQQSTMLSIEPNSYLPGTMFEWQSESGVGIIDMNGDTSITVDMEGLYTVIATHPGSGCLDSLTFEVRSENSRPDIQITSEAPKCEDEATGFIRISPTGLINSILLDGVSTTVDELDSLQPGSYRLIIQDLNGCELDTVVIVREPQPSQLSYPDILNLLKDANVDLSQYFTGVDLFNVDIKWFDPLGNEILQPFIPSLAGTYMYILIDENGCVHEGQVTVSLKEDVSIFVPNAFTPNGDGVNDVFIPSFDAGNLELNAFNIYNRWGDLVFTEDSAGSLADLKGWDGRFGSTPASPGVYVYQLVVVMPDGQLKHYTGDVTLIR